MQYAAHNTIQSPTGVSLLRDSNYQLSLASCFAVIVQMLNAALESNGRGFESCSP